MTTRVSDEDADEAMAATLSWLGQHALRPLARIWATVELERALADLGADPAAAAAALDDPLLGARVVVLAAADGGPDIALAEPSTEGRLALTLARHGEGPAGQYLAVAIGLESVAARADLAEARISRPAVGPFGWSVLIQDQSNRGWNLILVGPAAVPSRP
ncbi:MAG: hypothetical protein ABIZ72_10370 [Candidatus Limnocylindrales bacterium]